MKLNYKTISLPFEYPFTISKGTKTHQPALIVSLEHRGFTGYGEAPAIAYYGVTIENMVSILEERRALVEKFAFTEPERYWHYLHHLFPKDPFLVAALDMAAWDMFGKMRRQPLYKLWGFEWNQVPLCDYTIGIDSIDKMVEKLNAKPWPIYKVKLGTAEDIQIIENLRRYTEGIIRVDANAAWTLEEAMQIIPELAKLGVELVEQPLARDDWEGMKKLYAASPLPLFADESCVFENDVEKCSGYFHGINIKLTKCSGITPALRMVKKARELNLKLMVGSMNETTVGSAAIAHFLPAIDYVDMDGPLLLARDIASGLLYENGRVSIAPAPGLGIELIEPL